MTGIEMSGDSATQTTTAVVDMKLEVEVVPVSDVDRAKRFNEGLGFRLDIDHVGSEYFRVVQFMPPGSECSIIIGTGIASAAPGSLEALQRLRHRGRPSRARRPGRRRERDLPRRGRDLRPLRHRRTRVRPGSERPRLRLVCLVQRSGRQRLAAPRGQDPRSRPLTGRELLTRRTNRWTSRP
jgi:hypothetical protein